MINIKDKKNINISQYIKYTTDENNYYSKLFGQLDTEKKGILDSEKVANFMKTSGLNVQILQKIFLLNHHKNIHYTDKEEFFIILRLIGLAQNNMPYTIENLIKNSPIPPLPRFNEQKSNNNNIMNEKIFELSENHINLYKKIFYSNKDTNKDYISQIKAIVLFHQQKYGEKIEKVLELLNPFEQQSFLNLREFIVASHLLYITKTCDVPSKLPQNLAIVLGRNQNSDCRNINVPNKFQKVNNPQQTSPTPKPSAGNRLSLKENQMKNEKIIIDNKITENLKRTQELTQKNEKINQRLIELNEEIKKLKIEQTNIQNQLNINKKEYNELLIKQNNYKTIGIKNLATPLKNNINSLNVNNNKIDNNIINSNNINLNNVNKNLHNVKSLNNINNQLNINNIINNNNNIINMNNKINNNNNNSLAFYNSTIDINDLAAKIKKLKDTSNRNTIPYGINSNNFYN